MNDRGPVAAPPRPLEQARWWPTRPAPRAGWSRLWKIGALVGAAFGLIVALSAALLFYADFSMAANGSSDVRARAAWAIDHGDHLHLAWHMVAGRVLDVCPCSRRAAANQYFHGKFHALTPRQKDAVTNVHPRSAGEWAGYFSAPFGVGLEWVGDGIAWLRGQRPSSKAFVALDQYEFSPNTMHIARGTTVVWRNIDELGEAHTVTADPGTWLLQFDSRWLEPEEQFSATFTERGVYSYHCQAHGAPEHGGMSGTIVVE